MAPYRFDFRRYLAAKTTIDDRSLNAQVWSTMAAAMAQRQASADVRVIEVGAGIGTMLHRLLGQGVLWRGSYTGVDSDGANILRADRLLPQWARRHAWQSQARRGRHLLRAQHASAAARFVAGDFAAFARRPSQRQAWDAVVAHAFLDLVPLESAVALLLSLLRPGGLFYFSLNFDGETILLPEIDGEFDRQVIHTYHRTMDERLLDGRRSGDSRTGRHLLAGLPSWGGEILAAGSSDWVVVPRGGAYPADEAFFLHFICHTLGNALRRRREIDRSQLRRWIERRHRQIDHGELIYIAHQLDVVGTRPG
ncbi:MAG: class I SAM-dependent methyltransferase [Anaerolineales bacterium]|nr:class I SAM-dependent methyltransferase [Anaerolineales bacterium]